MKTTETIGLLLALGMGTFIPNASAELPKPGLYKGTLTITRTMGDRDVVDPGPSMTVKTVFKATARVDAEGFIRVTYSGDRAPIFGKLVEGQGGGNDLLYTGTGPEPTFGGTFGTQTITFSTGLAESLSGPDNQLVGLETDIVTKLRRVGN